MQKLSERCVKSVRWCEWVVTTEGGAGLTYETQFEVGQRCSCLVVGVFSKVGEQSDRRISVLWSRDGRWVEWRGGRQRVEQHLPQGVCVWRSFGFHSLLPFLYVTRLCQSFSSNLISLVAGRSWKGNCRGWLLTRIPNSLVSVVWLLIHTRYYCPA